MPVALAPKITSSPFFYAPSSDYYSSAMSGDDDENWATIEDKNVRRRIQNRHSQRKRRRKLKEQRLSMDSRSNSISEQESCPTRDASAQRPSCDRNQAEYSSTSKDLQRITHNRSVSEFSSRSNSLGQNHLTGEDTSLRLRNSRSASESSTLSTPPFPPDSRTYHDPVSIYELEGFDWTALDLLDDKVTSSVFPDDRLMDFNGLENQNEILNAQIQMAFGLGSLVETQDMDYLPWTNPQVNSSKVSSALENYLVPSKAAGCFPATTQLSELAAGHGSTALHLAAQQGHLQIAQLLLETAADVNAINSDGESTLHLAVAAKNHTMVSLLLKYGADPNVRNRRQESVLHLAVETGDRGLVELLLTRAVDLELQDALGQTAFHRAAAKGLEDVVMLLICKGADLAANVGSTH